MFLVEAMWTGFAPAVVKLREWISVGAIGEVRLLTTNIEWRHPYDPQSRLFSPELAGGALLDLGVYPVSLASMLLGRPTDISGVMHPAPTGVDAQRAVSLACPSGALGAFFATFLADAPCDAFIIGTEGWIRVHPPIISPEALTCVGPDGAEETVDLPYSGSGYAHEAIEVMGCLRDGRLGTDVMRLDESLVIMRTLDVIRVPWRLRQRSG